MDLSPKELEERYKENDLLESLYQESRIMNDASDPDNYELLKDEQE